MSEPMFPDNIKLIRDSYTVNELTNLVVKAANLKFDTKEDSYQFAKKLRHNIMLSMHKYAKPEDILGTHATNYYGGKNAIIYSKAVAEAVIENAACVKKIYEQLTGRPLGIPRKNEIGTPAKPKTPVKKRPRTTDKQRAEMVANLTAAIDQIEKANWAGDIDAIYALMEQNRRLTNVSRIINHEDKIARGM